MGKVNVLLEVKGIISVCHMLLSIVSRLYKFRFWEEMPSKFDFIDSFVKTVSAVDSFGIFIINVQLFRGVPYG
jgi:hypothetical protein